MPDLGYPQLVDSKERSTTLYSGSKSKSSSSGVEEMDLKENVDNKLAESTKRPARGRDTMDYFAAISKNLHNRLVRILLHKTIYSSI